MIEETCLRIDALQERWVAEREARYARRNKIRYIDDLLNQFEELNLAEEAEVPSELRGEVQQFVLTERHPLAAQSPYEIRIADWMEALYDLQDTLMIPFEDDVD